MKVAFGPFTFDAGTRQLLRDGRELHLSPKAFDLLLLLLERRPAVVSKAEVLARIWPDTSKLPEPMDAAPSVATWLRARPRVQRSSFSQRTGSTRPRPRAVPNSRPACGASPRGMDSSATCVDSG